MDSRLHILILEDVADDKELIDRALSKGGIEFLSRRVETKKTFLEELTGFLPDLILSDHSLPQFDSFAALTLAKEKCPDVPFILVSGAIGEELAIEMLRKGATDYVLKSNLTRLPSAVKRALVEAKERTERRRAEMELRKSEEKYRSVVENINIGIAVISPDMEILSLNRQMQEWFPDVDVSKRPLCYKAFNCPPREDVCDYCPTFKTLRDGEVHESVTETPAGDKMINYRVVSSPLKDASGKITGAIEMVDDITERKKAERRIEYLAYYDALTGLPNRNLFIDKINERTGGGEAASGLTAVLITDIDRFKYINDTYGHKTGDRVLREVGKRLLASVRSGDIVARLGNDEYGVAFCDLTSSGDIIMLEKLIRDISYPLKLNGDEVPLALSAGISFFPHDGKDAHELLRSAGLALSAAKKEGREGFQYYNDDISSSITGFVTLEKNLFRALKREEFLLHYQPYWDISTKALKGTEALVRWQSEDKGLVPPGKFIPVLEETGLIVEVGEWILRTAVRQVKEWMDKGFRVVPVSVNISLRQFRRRNLAEMIKKVMGEFGFYPSLLTLEITESTFMRDIEFTSMVLKELKDIGVSVSVDDFGTGYSSLASLKRLPVDHLKIDRSFIKDVSEDPDMASIVQAIMGMAHALNIRTIAEGVETEEQWNFLRLLRCDMGQGFYLSKPLPAEEFEKLLH